MAAPRAQRVAFIFKKALISALVALVLFSLMIGVRTEAGPSGQLTYWTRFDDLAAMVAAVFGGSIVVELLRQWWGPVGTIRVVPPSVQSALAVARRAIAPLLLIFTFLVPVIFYNQRYILDLGIQFSPTHRIVLLFYLILALALLTNWVTIRLRRLPLGRAWEALREDEVACRALGINITTTKLTAFATGAMFGGFAGAFFATRQGFISPESFTFQESALVLAIVVLGGMGSQLGVALAALAMIGGFELFRGLEQYRMLVFGLAMVLLMIWRPRGLIGHRAPTVYLKQAQAISSDLVKEGHG